MIQRRGGGVAKAETAHDDLQRARSQRPEPAPGELDFHHGEEARHEELLTQLHLENLQPVERADPPAAQGDHTDGRILVIEFGKVAAHPTDAAGFHGQSPAHSGEHGAIANEWITNLNEWGASPMPSLKRAIATDGNGSKRMQKCGARVGRPEPSASIPSGERTRPAPSRALAGAPAG